MPGTVDGGQKASKTTVSKYGPEFFATIGKIGGSRKTEATKRRGFGSDRERARIAGAKGGAARRAKREKFEVGQQED